MKDYMQDEGKNEKNDKSSKGKVKSINIDILDDGTFAASIYMKGKSGLQPSPYENCKKYSYQNVDDLLNGIEEEVD